MEDNIVLAKQVMDIKGQVAEAQTDLLGLAKRLTNAMILLDDLLMEVSGIYDQRAQRGESYDKFPEYPQKEPEVEVMSDEEDLTLPPLPTPPIKPEVKPTPIPEPAINLTAEQPKKVGLLDKLIGKDKDKAEKQRQRETTIKNLEKELEELKKK